MRRYCQAKMLHSLLQLLTANVILRTPAEREASPIGCSTILLLFLPLLATERREGMTQERARSGSSDMLPQRIGRRVSAQALFSPLAREVRDVCVFGARRAGDTSG